MQITFDSHNLSDLDKQVLTVLLGGDVSQFSTGSAPVSAPAKAAAPKATPKASKPVEAPVEEPEEAPEEEATVAEDAPTLDEAVALATKMVSNGEAAKVKKALGTVGAKKVSEIPEDKVGEFIAALS